MPIRLKWEIENKNRFSNINDYSETDRRRVLNMIDNNLLSVHFQPIFSSKDGAVYGYEALTRIKGDNDRISISDLFLKAILTKTIFPLDMQCRENAIREAAIQNINNSGSYLFINICPETFTDPAYRDGVTDELAEKYGISKEKIILEITEEAAIQNWTLFKQAIDKYRNRGYKIAIDDFGAGYGGLKMLSTIEPDFIKIDRHFISNIERANINFNLVDTIATLCFRIGIKVIAEGIEQEEELMAISNIGIELLQGYYLAKPSPVVNGSGITIPAIHVKKSSHLHTNGECNFIGDIADKVETIHPTALVTTTFDMFIKNSKLWVLPVIESERAVGMLYRRRFFEEQVLGRCGYGMHLNAHKNVRHVMEPQFLTVEANTLLEDVVQRVNSRRAEFIYDDICVTENGRYSGIVAINNLLDAINKKSLILARGSNPLSGLPGNEFIQREIDKRLSQNIHFDVCYIDINNFKPYNDHYGFERGDFVIKTLANVLIESIKSFEANGFNFAGHIGGDDFIIITRPQISIPLCEKIISVFESRGEEFHGIDDYKNGFYQSKNRRGEDESFMLLSISIGIVSTEVHRIHSYAHLASLAAEVKHVAKTHSDLKSGSSIVRDRRLMVGDNVTEESKLVFKPSEIMIQNQAIDKKLHYPVSPST